MDYRVDLFSEGQRCSHINVKFRKVSTVNSTGPEGPASRLNALGVKESRHHGRKPEVYLLSDIGADRVHLSPSGLDTVALGRAARVLSREPRRWKLQSVFQPFTGRPVLLYIFFTPAIKFSPPPFSLKFFITCEKSLTQWRGRFFN